MLNLFIAVILEGFGGAEQDSESALNKDQMAAFRDLWVTYDPECTYYINSSKLERFLEELEPPMGFGKKKKTEQNIELRKEVRHMISQMNLTMYDGNRVFFLDAMHAVGRQVIERDALKKGHSFVDIASTHPVNVAWKQRFMQYTSDDKKPMDSGAVVSLLQASGSKRMKKAHSSATVEEFYAAEIIREAFNAFRFRRNMEKRIEKRKEADAATECDNADRLSGQ